MQGFEPIELNILDYDSSRGSHIAPHFDDFWIWGERIIGINLLEDTVLTFYQGEKQLEVEIPRRCLYLISRESRFDWMHGIKMHHIKGRRMVCTLREIGEEFGRENQEKVHKIIQYIN